MTITVRDVMKKDVRTVAPDLPLSELQRTLIEHKVSGFPVVEEGRLVGVVSRSDIVRIQNVTRSYEEQLSEFYVVAGVQRGEHPEAAAATGAGVGARMEKLTVSDAMIRDVLTANAGDDIAAVARLLVEHRIHRLPVVEGGTLVGIVTSLDLVGLIADARLRGD